MQVQLIPSSEVNSDLGIVNAARVSLAKRHATFVEPDDRRLLAYLLTHHHWTPLAHARLYLHWKPRQADLLDFLLTYTPAGFAHTWDGVTLHLKGSLYAWLMHGHHLPPLAASVLSRALWQRYPVTAALFFDPATAPSQQAAHDTCALLEEATIIAEARWQLATATLLVTVPLFVARQIRTSQVGFAYDDLYVEGESFTYNEVSRRYVTELPGFYWVKSWRTRHGTRVKQGSTGVASAQLQEALGLEQSAVLGRAVHTYVDYDTIHHIAPEQLRALLPQTMYTSFWMTATLHRWAQFLALRRQPDVQPETQEVATQMAAALAAAFPAWATTYRGGPADA
jgi:thymidylate synthase (FAD)